MKTFNYLLVLICVVLSGCAYNSRNLIDVRGENLKFNYGLIAIDGVNRVILLRETNAGSGDAPEYLPEPKIEIMNAVR